MIWLHRSFAFVLLLFGSLNAASYFVRSVDFGNLLGTHPHHSEYIGFPWILARRHCTGPDWHLDFEGFYANLAAGIVTWLVVGAFAFAFRHRLDRLEHELTEGMIPASQAKANFQFSLRGLLILMAICAVAAAGAGQLLAGRPEVLAAIYALGPWILIGLAYLPARIPWQQRVALIIPLTLILIGLAVVAGAMLESPLDFEKTLLGIFVCWTPQAAITALVLTIVILVRHMHSRGTRPIIAP